VSGPTVVSVAGKQVTLRKPTSPSAGWEAVSLRGVSELAACGAALALCWPAPGRGVEPPPALLTALHTQSCAAWGRGAADALLLRGVSIGDLMQAGGLALDLVSATILPEADVQAAEAFSAGEAGTTGPSSPSAAPTVSPPPGGPA